MTFKLDLHGVKHQDAARLVESFVYTNQDRLPLTIICGNSNKMLKIVESKLDEMDCEYTMYRYGVVTVGRFK